MTPESLSTIGISWLTVEVGGDLLEPDGLAERAARTSPTRIGAEHAVGQEHVAVGVRVVHRHRLLVGDEVVGEGRRPAR